MEFDQGLGHVQAESDARVLTGRGRIGLEKRFEDSILKKSRNAGTVVGDGDSYVIEIGRGVNVNFASQGRVLDRIRQEVQEHLLHSSFIACNGQRLVTGRDDLDTFGFRVVHLKVRHFLKQRSEIARGDGDRDSAIGEFSQVEERIHQFLQTLGVFRRNAQQFLG